jgi:hypothetical protein
LVASVAVDDEATGCSFACIGSGVDASPDIVISMSIVSDLLVQLVVLAVYVYTDWPWESNVTNGIKCNSDVWSIRCVSPTYE